MYTVLTACLLVGEVSAVVHIVAHGVKRYTEVVHALEVCYRAQERICNVIGSDQRNVKHDARLCHAVFKRGL